MWTRDFNDVKRKRKIKERLCNDLDKNFHRKLGKHSGELPRRQKAKKKRSSTIYHSCIFDESYTGFIFNFGILSCIALKEAQIQILFSSLQCGFPKLEKISVPASKRKNKWKLIFLTHKMLVRWHIWLQKGSLLLHLLIGRVWPVPPANEVGDQDHDHHGREDTSNNYRD